MNDVFQEIIADDPKLSHYFELAHRNTPVPHFWCRPPKLDIIDFGATNPAIGMSVGKQNLTDHLLNYKYSNVKGVVTQRGFSKKWQILIDLETGDQIEGNEEGTYPWRDFYDASELKRMWYLDLWPQACNIWFPTLYPGSNALAKKVRITYVKDTISTKAQFLHPYEQSDSNVLLSVHVHIFSPIPTWITLQNESDMQTQTHLLSHHGAGIVTSPQRNPYSHRLFTSTSYESGDTFSKDIIDDSHTMYLKFDFIE